MRAAIQRIAVDLRHLIFPEACLICSRELSREEKHLCSFCLHELPRTNMQDYKDEPTPLEKLFWGRIQLEFAYSHLFFQKKGPSQRILFNIKYSHNQMLAEFFGEEIGRTIHSKMDQTGAEALIPIPLHHRKQFIRGYNQSEKLGTGIARTSGIPLMNDLVKRRRFTETQTKKSRFERWGNLNNAFEVSPEIQKFRYIVLVDDVATTGATIEQLVLEIRKVHPTVRFSVVTLALA